MEYLDEDNVIACCVLLHVWLRILFMLCLIKLMDGNLLQDLTVAVGGVYNGRE